VQTHSRASRPERAGSRTLLRYVRRRLAWRTLDLASRLNAPVSGGASSSTVAAGQHRLSAGAETYRSWSWTKHRYLVALLIPLLCTAIALPLYPRIDAVNVAMVYVLGTAIGALRLGRAASALCATGSVAAFDFLFIPPRFSFYVADARYVLTFGAMLGIAILIAELVARAQFQAQRQIVLAAERARLAEAAARARADVRRAALCNTLLASISHDLRAPLTAIAGAGSLVAQTQNVLDAHRRTVLGELIEDKAREMTELLTNVLDLMRLETAPTVKRGWQSLEELISTAIRYKQARLGSWRIRAEIPGDLPLIHVDGQLIVQLLSNLLENAAKYTPPGTCIRLVARAQERAIELVVEDDGPGFGADEPARLFDRFQQGISTGLASGAGLGLAICRAIAELHDGYIRAENASPRGARFIITLPTEPANRPE